MTAGRPAAAGLALGLVLALSGCILQTEAPLIGDASAAPLLGTGEQRLDLFEPDPGHPGDWRPAETAHLAISYAGGHYHVPDPDDPGNAAKASAIWFLPLDAGHAVVQVEDPAGMLYGIARWDGKVLDLAMLDCEALKTAPESATWVTFDGSDCHPRAGTLDTVALFSALAPLAPEPTLRAVVAR